MAYNYLEANDLKDALAESEKYMKTFYDDKPELERITRGKPGKVAPGKPKVTDGTLAAIRREKPKQIIQQLPTGKAVIKDTPDIEAYVTAVLTDIILPNANSGGDPYVKSQDGIKDTFDAGSAWAECFMNRTEDVFHADFRLKSYKEVLFEKGKVSEFDTNFLPVVDYKTIYDLKAILYWEQYLQRQAKDRGESYKGKWNLKLIQKLIDSGAKQKDDDYKTEEEKKYSDTNGYFKLVRFYQKGKGATFYTYSPALDEVVYECINPDIRGIIPVHGLIPEPDRANPLGEPLAAISAGKQNLIDYDMQNYQYNQGMGTDPAIKKWGQTPDSKIQIAPGKIISMMGTKATDDFEVVNLANEAVRNYAQNYGLLKSQVLNEMGHRTDSSISASSGNPGFSKTDAGVKQNAQITDTSNNALRKAYESWFGRICATMLNIHFAESKGVKALELKPETMQRLKLTEAPEMDYDADYGPITFTIDASTSQASDNEAENEKLTALLELKLKYGNQADSKTMQIINQVIQNSGVDDPENIQYSDDEIEQAKAVEEFQREQAMQQLMTPPAPTVGEPPLPAEALQPAQPDPAIEEDRAIAMQQLIERGATPEEAEAAMQAIERGEL